MSIMCAGVPPRGTEIVAQRMVGFICPNVATRAPLCPSFLAPSYLYQNVVEFEETGDGPLSTISFKCCIIPGKANRRRYLS